MNINLINYDALSEEKIHELIRGEPTLICSRVPRSESNCLIAVQQNGRMLEFVPKSIQTHEICLAAVANCGYSLKYVSPKVISKDICRAAIVNEPYAFAYVPRWIMDDEILETAFSLDGALLRYFPYVSKELRTIAVSQNGLALEFVEKSYKRKRLCTLAVQQNGLALQFVPEKIRDEELCDIALSQTALALQFVPEKLKVVSRCEKAVLQEPLALQFVPDKLRTPKLCGIAVNRNAMALEFVPDARKSMEICRQALDTDYQFVCYIPSHLLDMDDYIAVLKKLNAEISVCGRRDEVEKKYSLVEKSMIDWPEEIQESTEIRALCRTIGFRRVIVKKYDAEKKLFCVAERYMHLDETRTREFAAFREFYDYLDGNLSGSDLYDYDFADIDLTAYSVVNAGISSEVLVRQGVYDPEFYDSTIAKKDAFYGDQLSQSNELVPAEAVLHPTDFNAASPNTKRKLYYISDLHIDHKLKKKFPLYATKNEVKRFVASIIDKMIETADERDYDDYLLIAGDVSFSFEISEMFHRLLARKWSRVITVMGNHELWDCVRSASEDSHSVVERCASRYSELSKELGFVFLHNDLLVLDGDGSRNIIQGTDIISATDEQLRNLRGNLISNSRLLVLGGLGFSGYNSEFNAKNGLYRQAIPALEEDVAETRCFEALHNRLVSAVGDMPLVVLTHTPKTDWSRSGYNKKWIYVHGHDHRNQFFDDEEKTVYADNQIGYQNLGSIGLKHFFLDKTMDIFMDYPDGIHKITREQYIAFNRGKQIYIRFNRTEGQIVMLKNSGLYCFLFENEKGKYLLNGGVLNKLGHSEYEYYYHRIPMYAAVVSEKFKQYYALLNRIAIAVKRFGGDGRVHGSIIDINYFNHLIINPETLQITPYYATDMYYKKFYANIRDLLIENCEHLHEQYLALQVRRPDEFRLLEHITDSVEISKATVVTDTSIYKLSALTKKVQYLLDNNIIRVWDESVFEEARQYGDGILMISAGEE